jgi:hypothetical protein
LAKQFETRSTSRSTAAVLREGAQVRLVFVPALVENLANPKASVDGQFVYQRKARSGRWIPVPAVSLATLKEGDAFKLTLHAQELLTLLEGLVPLYQFYRDPRPARLLSMEFGSWYKRSKMRALASGSIPRPVSLTER